MPSPRQASFDPPGIALSVKKDRAMGDFFYPGAQFSISIVPEASERPIMKALTKKFEPGADRLASLETEVSEGTGCAVLKVRGSGTSVAPVFTALFPWLGLPFLAFLQRSPRTSGACSQSASPFLFYYCFYFFQYLLRYPA